MRNSKSKKNLVAVLALVLVVAVAGILAACSSGNGDNNGGNSGITNGSSNTSPDDGHQTQAGYYAGLVSGDAQSGWSLNTDLYVQYVSENYYDGAELKAVDTPSQIPARSISSFSSAGYGDVNRLIENQDIVIVYVDSGEEIDINKNMGVYFSTERGVLTRIEGGDASHNQDK